MKKFVLFLILLIIGVGVYFLLQKKAPPIELPVEEKIEKEEIIPETPEIIPEVVEEEKIERPYLGPDFTPIEPPQGELQMDNKISENFESLVLNQFLNPEIPQMKADIVKKGTYIWVKSGIGRFIIQISVTITSPGSSPHAFTAFADAQTGEIIQTQEATESEYNSGPIEESRPMEELPSDYENPDNYPQGNLESPPIEPPPAEEYNNDYFIDDM